MIKLEELTKGMTIKGVLPDSSVQAIDVKWIGSIAVELTYKDSSGKLGNELLYRNREEHLEIEKSEYPWSFNADGGTYRLVSEARRIKLAYLFDPMLAVHTSMVEPLPHQITAVYGELIPRQPLRFLLADDPGAGKTIMAGLFIKELIVRGDLRQCLIVCPGNLADQWQDELWQKFHLAFTIMTKDALEASITGNWFIENPLIICRLDKLSRNEELQAKLRSTDWDLIICDEAHKMSAHYFGGEVTYTKRYKLGQLLSSITRHFLLMTATPHNGKEEDFQLFMALLDGDRFEGRFRNGVHATDTSDLMRRLVKEQLYRFNGEPLFPERIAYTANYVLSSEEWNLYQAVTEYVREEFNRADKLINGKKGTVGFALTVLQRRLASSSEAAYQSLKRRRERLEKRLREEQLNLRPSETEIDLNGELPDITDADLDDFEELPDAEIENTEEQLIDYATSARTITELKKEIETLRGLESMALNVRKNCSDRKWEELSSLLQNEKEMFNRQGHRRKLLIFTEHKDTLVYLYERISTLLGRPEAVVTIHGAMGREQRKNAEQKFTQDKNVDVLVATDAAGEGINLQRAHLMVNYDLPWNPNRLEQRFGRIHRIGQNEVCHCWNLVASGTREGDVYYRLLKKLDEERKALGGRVFDILGRLTFENKPLRELLMEAILYGEREDVRSRLHRAVDTALDRENIRQLLEEKALARDTMDTRKIHGIREEMERAEARKLQPHFIATFFVNAFKSLGGTIREREPRRYEINHVPVAIRNRDRIIGSRTSILQRYERITFEKDLITVDGKPVADFVCPSHPLLDATIDIVLERHREVLKSGAVLVDENDTSDNVRLLVALEHSIQDARTDKSGQRRVVSRRFQFIEMDLQGQLRNGGFAPYLDYRAANDDEKMIADQIITSQLPEFEFERAVLEYAAEHLIPDHLKEIMDFRKELISKTTSAVKSRLAQEIRYWDNRALELEEDEKTGKVNARLNSSLARQRADRLSAQLEKRLAELEQERKITPLPPVIVGGALILPAGIIVNQSESKQTDLFAVNRKNIELEAMNAVMETERSLGFIPKDVSALKCGYDIESGIPNTGALRFIEVKGRVEGATTVTVTRNEIMDGLNKPDSYILAIVFVNDHAPVVHYITAPFSKEPDFGVTSVNYTIDSLLKNAVVHS